MKKYVWLLFILFIPAICFSETIRKTTWFFPPFEGLNTSLAPLILSPQSLVSADNVLYDPSGVRKKRGGIVHLNESSCSEASGSNKIVGLFDFKKISTSGTETRTILAHANRRVYKIDAFDGTLDDITGANFLTVDKQADFAVLRQTATTTDTVIMVNGADLPKTWNQDASTVSDLTGYPTGIDFYPSCIETHKYRLFAAGVPSYPYRLYFSAANKWNDWNTGSDAGYIDIIDNMGSKIVGLAGNYYDYLIIFLEKSIFILTGTGYSSFAVQPLIAGVGAINNAGIIAYGQTIYFVSDRGIHNLSTTQKYGDIVETFISSVIQDDFTQLNHARLQYCAGTAFPEKNYLIWSFSSGGSITNDICFVYDILGNRWSKWNNINASSLAVVKSNINVNELIAGDYSGYINRLNRENYHDNNSAYTMSFTTPYLSFGDPKLSKTFKELFVLLNPQNESNVTVTYQIDDKNSNTLSFSQLGSTGVLDVFTLDEDTLDGGVTIPLSKKMTGAGRILNLTFTQDTNNTGSEIIGYGVEYLYNDVDYSN